MRGVLCTFVVIAMVAALIPSAALAASAGTQQGGTLTGVALGADGAPVRECKARLRSVNDGRLKDETACDQAGAFVFTNVQPGNYVVEIVDAAGKIVGMSPSIGVVAGSTASITVTGSAAGALTVGPGGGFSLFGLGTLTSVAVIGAAGATAVAAVVATRDAASPSR